MGKLVLEVVGAAVGAYLGGPQGAAIGFELGGLAGGLVFPNKINAPSVPPTLMQRSAYGAMLPIGKGVFRVAGNVIWEGGISAQQSQSSQGKGGPTVTTTSYFATFACSVCDTAATGPISGIRRIWMNGQIVYDVSSSANGATLVASGNFARNNMVVYLGTGTQTTDPTMQAALGVGNTSAYRFTAYVVFVNVPLQAFGNTIPVVNFEVVTDAIAGGLSQVFEVGTMSGPTWEGVHYTINGQGNSPIILGVSPNILIIDRSLGANTYAGSLGDGKVYYYSTANGGLVTQGPQSALPSYQQNQPVFSSSWANSWTDSGNNNHSRGNWIFATTDGNYVVWGGTQQLTTQGAYPSGTFIYDLYALMITISGWSTETIRGVVPCVDFAHVLVYTLTSKWAILNCIHGSEAVVSHGTVSSDSGHVFSAGGTPLAASTASTYTPTPGPSNGPSTWACLQSDLKTLWAVGAYGDTNATSGQPALYGQLSVMQIDASSILQVIAGQILTGPPNWEGTPSFPNTGKFYGSYPMSMWADNGYCAIVAGQSLTAWQLGGFTNVNQITLDKIVTPLVEAVGVAAANLDTTKIATVGVWGALIEGQGQLRRAMESLSPTFWFDMVESDQKLSFRQRTSTPLFTIPIDDMGAVENDKPSDNPLTITMVDDLSLPKQVDVAYYNIGADHQIGSQYARRLTSSSTQRTAISAAAVMADQDAANAAAVILWDSQAGRLQFEFETSLKYGQIEPTDIGTLVDAAVSYLVRMVEKHEQGPVIKWKAVGAAPVYNQNVSPGIITPATQTVSTTGQTTLVLLDIAPLRDQDGNTGTPYLYVAMCGQDGNWRGASLFKSNDGGASWVLQLSSTQPSTIGLTTTALTDWPNLHNEFDECSTVTVNLSTPGGSLASATALGVLNGANLCSIGKELLQFKNATLVGGSIWTLSGLLRGRFDTWQSTTGHQIGETFVLLSQSTGAAAALNIETEGTPDIGTSRIYQAVTTGQSIGSGIDQTIVSKGDNLVCFPPFWLLGAAAGSGNGDILLSWIRSNRITFQWLESVDVPMSEASEAYTVTIFADNTFTTIKRTIAVSGSGVQNATYTAAQQNTDFGASQSTLYWGVQQISAITGAGDMTKATSAITAPAHINALVLMHFDGTNGSTSFPDVYGHTTSFNGGAQISTAQSEFGGASALFNGTNSNVTVTPSSGDLNFGTGDFTVEFWFRYTGTGNPPNFPCMVGNNNATWSPGAVAINCNTTSNPNKVQVGVNDYGNPPLLISTTTISPNTWYALAFVRHGNTFYLFINGNLDNSNTFTGNINMANNGLMNIGNDGWDGANGYFTGYIDELRVSNVARYTANYTPSGPFTY